MKVRVLGDSSPLKGLLERRGTGKMKQLWMQEKVRNKSLEFEKIPRLENPGDATTHHWTKSEGDLHFGRMGVRSNHVRSG